MPRIYEKIIVNNESPLEPFQNEQKKVIIQPYLCLICLKQGKKAETRKPQKKELASFFEALLLCKHCNGYGIRLSGNFIGFELKVWTSDFSQIRWHINCYASFVS